VHGRFPQTFVQTTPTDVVWVVIDLKLKRCDESGNASAPYYHEALQAILITMSVTEFTLLSYFCTSSIPNYKSFQRFWRVKTSQI
jgi:hypothetical protein